MFMDENITIYVDYIGNRLYGVFLNEPIKDSPDFELGSVSASLKFISEKYGIDTHVEISHCAEIIFKIENSLDINTDLTGQEDISS